MRLLCIPALAAFGLLALAVPNRAHAAIAMPLAATATVQTDVVPGDAVLNDTPAIVPVQYYWHGRRWPYRWRGGYYAYRWHGGYYRYRRWYHGGWRYY
jgi:hypothetical protein